MRARALAARSSYCRAAARRRDDTGPCPVDAATEDDEGEDEEDEDADKREGGFNDDIVK